MQSQKSEVFCSKAKKTQNMSEHSWQSRFCLLLLTHSENEPLFNTGVDLIYNGCDFSPVVEPGNVCFDSYLGGFYSWHIVPAY